MIADTPQNVVKSLVNRGLQRELTAPVRRELRKAQAQGILRGIVANLGPDDVCVDLGAHIGEVSLDLAKTGAQVHAYEPDPDTFETLQKATHDHSNITLHQKAVGAKAGTATLYRSELSKTDAKIGATGSTLLGESANADDENTVEVDVEDIETCLRDLLKTHGRIAFLKMDVEGAEVDILEHLIETDILPQIGLTVVETHRWLMKDQAHRIDKLHDIAAERPELNLYLMWI